MSKIIVSHAYYGCDTGCCGHVISIDDDQLPGFHFEHPYNEDALKWAQELVRCELGAEHIADLDWDNCTVIDD